MYKKKVIFLYDSVLNYKFMNFGECWYFWIGVEKKRDRKLGFNYLKKFCVFYWEISIYM